MKPEKQMEYKGITIRPSCLMCTCLNDSPNAKSYRCCCKGSCPHYLSDDDKEYILTNFRDESKLVQVQEATDIEKELIEKLSEDIRKEIDNQILEELKSKMS